jgi:PPK2 family polyphosphate:nucleotide phosphotransferase
MIEDFLVKEGKKFKLSGVDPDFKSKKTKEELKELTAKNVEKIVSLQEKLYAESKQSLLVVFQAIDGGGKDGTIKKVFSDINPQGCVVTSFKTPTALELKHDFLWRIHQHTPEKGMIQVFNRSHYEDVLIVKVHGWIDDEECGRRFHHIRAFEKLLSESGTKIVKIFLCISKDEQKKRFEERLKDPAKNWKFAQADLDERKFWDKYMEQYQKVLSETSTGQAPWYVVPADSNSFRNYVVSTIVLKALEDMDPHFPPPEAGLDKVQVI